METGQTFSLDYPSINMHSISRDKSNFPHECLFLMVEGNLRAKAEAIMKGEYPTSSSRKGEDDLSDMRFVLQDSTQLQSLFDVMSDCQVRTDAAYSIFDLLSSSYILITLPIQTRIFPLLGT